MNETKKTLKYVKRIVLENKPSVLFIYSLMLVSNIVVKFIGLVFFKWIIDEVAIATRESNIEEHILKAALLVLIMIFIQCIMNMIEGGCIHFKNVYSEWFNEYLELSLSNYIMKLDFEYTENPDVLNRIAKARDGISWYSGGIVGVLDGLYTILMNLVVLAGASYIIFWICPMIIPIQVLALVLVFWCNKKRNEMKIGFFKDLSKYNRGCDYVFYQLADSLYGKDIRLYDAQLLMKEKAQKYANKLIDIWKQLGKKQCLNSWIVDIINAFRDGTTLLIIGAMAIDGKITVGELSLCIASASAVYWSLSSVMEGGQETIKKSSYVYNYIDFLSYPNIMKSGSNKVERVYEIEFKHVSFRYPRSNQYALKDINIKLCQGEHLSIVGENGSGKTTFIKLLCRLYDVSDGQILINGIDIRDYSIEEYRELLAVVFQDYKIFAFRINDNICAGTEEDDDRVDEILCKVGLSELVKHFKYGKNTMIHKSFDKEGIELSGGEMQKMAIARALYKDASIIILDEPTASLDPMAEYEVYHRFNELIDGKTAIYISHRLASCKFCDKIAVFDKGWIKEYGSHEELMKKPEGLYKNMFESQAKYYA